STSSQPCSKFLKRAPKGQRSFRDSSSCRRRRRRQEMGKKAKTSRKGKKAWRANISTDDVDDFIEKSTKDALTGGSLSEVSNESLFFVDKSKDLTVRRKIEKHREKVLHCDSVLQRNPFVKAVPSSKENKPINGKKKKQKKDVKDQSEAAVEKNDTAQDGESGITDLWENEEDGDNRTRKVVKPSIIPAVEVEPPGCSYNPSFEAHQDSLAQAVAEEMQKVYKDELGPQPVPLTVQGEAIGEEEMYFLEVDKEDDEAIEDNEAIENNEDNAEEKSSSKRKRVTRVESNRRARLKELRGKEAEAKKKKELLKEIDSLPKIMEEIAKEDEEKQNRHTRRVVAKQERLKTQPPRLGRHKFEPAPTQVLLSEEITGSLRQVKGCCTLATDRFKSLEKRGLIPPSSNKKRRRY
ncbi:Ribosome biogenesis protein NOP53, partial [Linum grandiflorum]